MLKKLIILATVAITFTTTTALTLPVPTAISTPTASHTRALAQAKAKSSTPAPSPPSPSKSRDSSFSKCKFIIAKSDQDDNNEEEEKKKEGEEPEDPCQHLNVPQLHDPFLNRRWTWSPSSSFLAGGAIGPYNEDVRVREGGLAHGKRGDNDNIDNNNNDDDDDDEEEEEEDEESEDGEHADDEENEEHESEYEESEVAEGDDEEPVDWAVMDAMDEADCEDICSISEPLHSVCSRNREGELVKWRDGCELLRHNCLNPMDQFALVKLHVCSA